MRSAVLRLPSLITVLMNLLTSVLLYTGSAASSRFGISRLRGIAHKSCRESVSGIRDLATLASPQPRGPSPHFLLRPLGAVLRAALLATLHADSVERAADDVIPHAREILHTTAANEHERVLLEVVADTRDVGRHFDPVGEPDARHL